EDQPPDAVRSPEAQTESHPGAEGVTGDVHLLQPMLVEQREQRVERPVEGRLRGARALAVARKVRDERLEPRPEQRTEVAPRVRASGEPVEQQQGRPFTPAGMGEQAHGPPSSSARATAAPSAW